ncbi:MAG: hypothetical protein LW703_02395 [Rhodobacter sp.]|jgi:hypothetical protein|nr:hypothetical protein [Rhodobacter sp.]
MFDFATTTMSSAMPFVLPLMFALQPGASSVSLLREATELPQIDRRAVPLFEPTASSFESFQAVTQKPSTISQASAWVEGALEKIASYAEVNDGWRGEGSKAPTGQTLQEAAELLLQISSEMPDLFRPMISIDEDGCACLHWNAPDLLATISVYGDGTYSFFSEGYGVVASSDSHEIGTILPSDLIVAMTGQVLFEAQIAA